MAVLSVFDVLGPIMIGPSSSHTAGAVRIGWLAGKISGEGPEEIKLGFRGALMKTYKGHCADSGLVAGILGYREDDARIRGALEEAKRLGIAVSVEEIPGEGHPNEMRCSVSTHDGRRTTVTGVSIGGGNVEIREVNGVELKLDGSVGGYLVFADRAGSAGTLLGLFGEHRFGDVAVEDAGQFLFVPCPRRLSKEEEMRLRERADILLPGTRLAWVPPLLESTMSPAKRQVLFSTGAEMLDLCASQGLTVAEAALSYEVRFSGMCNTSIRDQMRSVLVAMKDAAKSGLEEPQRLLGGYVPGDDGKRLWEYGQGQSNFAGSLLVNSLARAIAVAEYNASMGKVVAAPTAGASGVVPGLLISAGECLGSDDEALVDGLLVAGIVGVLIGRVASFSGAMGGCQGEVGVGASIAAAAVTHLAGGTPSQVLNAAALSIKSLLGLVCDPVAGPVEVPCIKRNAGGVAIALACSAMSLAGVCSAVPFDEVVMALKNVQDQMPEDLRDNTMGGLGSTPTACAIKRSWAKRLESGQVRP